MFEYTTPKGVRFQIDAVSDEDNVTVFKEVEVENYSSKEGGGKGRGVALGTFRKEFREIGYYPSFKTALAYIIDRTMAEGSNVDELKEIVNKIETVLIPLAGTYQSKLFAAVRKSLEEKAENRRRNKEE